MILTVALTLALLSGCGDGSIQRKQVLTDIEGKINEHIHIVAHLQPVIERYERSNCVHPTGVNRSDASNTTRLGDKLEELGLATLIEKQSNTGMLRGRDQIHQYEFKFNGADFDNIIGLFKNDGRCNCGWDCERTATQHMSIYLGTLDDIEITGIEKISEVLNTASFRVTAKTNEISRTLFPNFDSMEGTFEYQLWDDGWREKNFNVKNPFEYSFGKMKVIFNTKTDTGLSKTKLDFMHEVGRYSEDYKKLIKAVLKNDDARPWDIQTVAQSYCDNGGADKAYKIFEKRILKELEGEQLETWAKNFDKFKSRCEPINTSKNNNQPSEPVAIETNSSGEKNELQTEKSYFSRASKWITSLFTAPERPQLDIGDEQSSNPPSNLEQQTSSLNKKEYKTHDQFVDMQVVASQSETNVPKTNNTKSQESAKTITSNVEYINEPTELKQKKLVLNIQRELTRLNLYHSRIDGIPGRGTTRGIKEFERQMGLPVNGTATPELFERIRAVPRNSIIPIDVIAKKTVTQEEKTEGTIIGNAAKKSFRWLGDRLKGKN